MFFFQNRYFLYIIPLQSKCYTLEFALHWFVVFYFNYVCGNYTCMIFVYTTISFANYFHSVWHLLYLINNTSAVYIFYDINLLYKKIILWKQLFQNMWHGSYPGRWSRKRGLPGCAYWSSWAPCIFLSEMLTEHQPSKAS